MSSALSQAQRENAARVQDFRRLGLRCVQVVGSGEECAACEALVGRNFPLAQAPVLPPQGCACIPWPVCILIGVASEDAPRSQQSASEWRQRERQIAEEGRQRPPQPSVVYPQRARASTRRSIPPAHAPCRRGIYLLLALILGGLGGHNFYAGYLGRAFGQIGLLVASFWFYLWGSPLGYGVTCALLVWVVVEMLTVTRDPHGVDFT